MSEFWLYVKLGITHVLDWNAYDHVLFLIVLTVGYPVSAWRKLLLLVTAFTLGHTFSLIATHYEVVQVDAALIEFLIPITILAAAVYSIMTARQVAEQKKGWLLYIITLFFGLIHGFGFGRYFNMINQDDGLAPLFEFALGIEISQLVVVFVVVLLASLLHFFFRISRRDWILVASSIVIGLVIPMLAENWIF
ncbi:HupE/UreJ family protein [Altibacter sp. HG106]|uniref:HupE/UreJ family protein n=1 Tax=Altibacter sp. HG106 TaxID=3023937 RepID=UPI002350FA72|nr:HupE/UreJ family protein [Altibacter sp. HG106]MDC7994777.1 HupE/UreJ family protein [Altibacter sp. HG106]